MAAPTEKSGTEKPTESFHEFSRNDSVSPEREKELPKHAIDPATENINAKLANPLAGIPQDQLMRDGAVFAKRYGLSYLENEFVKGALIAQDPLAFEKLDILSEKELGVLRREQNKKWSQPFTLYW